MKIAAAAVVVLGVTWLSAAPATITFTKDVAPILQQKCQVCHQPDSIGPMPLITYDDAREYADKIKRKVSQRLMPPWRASQKKKGGGAAAPPPLSRARLTILKPKAQSPKPTQSRPS